MKEVAKQAADFALKQGTSVATNAASDAARRTIARNIKNPAVSKATSEVVAANIKKIDDQKVKAAAAAVGTTALALLIMALSGGKVKIPYGF